MDNLAGLDGGDAVLFGLKVGLCPQDPELKGLPATGIALFLQFLPVADHVLFDDGQIGLMEGDGLLVDFPAFFSAVVVAGTSLCGRLSTRGVRFPGGSLGGQRGGRGPSGHLRGKGFLQFVGDEHRFRVVGKIIPPLLFAPPDSCFEKSRGHAVEGHLFGEGGVEHRVFNLFAGGDQLLKAGRGSFRKGRDGGVFEPDEVVEDFSVVGTTHPPAVIVGSGQFPADEAVTHVAFDGALPRQGGVVALSAELNVIIFLTVRRVYFVDVEIAGEPHLSEFPGGVVKLILGACPASFGGEIVEERFQEFLFLLIAALAPGHQFPSVGRVSEVGEGPGNLVESFLAGKEQGLVAGGQIHVISDASGVVEFGGIAGISDGLLKELTGLDHRRPVYEEFSQQGIELVQVIDGFAEGRLPQGRPGVHEFRLFGLVHGPVDQPHSLHGAGNRTIPLAGSDGFDVEEGERLCRRDGLSRNPHRGGGTSGTCLIFLYEEFRFLRNQGNSGDKISGLTAEFLLLLLLVKDVHVVHLAVDHRREEESAVVECRCEVGHHVAPVHAKGFIPALFLHVVDIVFPFGMGFREGGDMCFEVPLVPGNGPLVSEADNVGQFAVDDMSEGQVFLIGMFLIE